MLDINVNDVHAFFATAVIFAATVTYIFWRRRRD